MAFCHLNEMKTNRAGYSHPFSNYRMPTGADYLDRVDKSKNTYTLIPIRIGELESAVLVIWGALRPHRPNSASSSMWLASCFHPLQCSVAAPLWVGHDECQPASRGFEVRFLHWSPELPIISVAMQSAVHHENTWISADTIFLFNEIEAIQKGHCILTRNIFMQAVSVNDCLCCESTQLAFWCIQKYVALDMFCMQLIYW